MCNQPRQYVDRRFLLAMLSVPLMMCLLLLTDTPAALVLLAIFAVIIGGYILFNSPYLPYPWLTGIASFIVTVLGVAFLAWYFYEGRAILHPLWDPQKYLNAARQSLLTPTP